MNNWFGMKPHDADQLMNWRDKNPVKTAKTLREAYDRIVLAYPSAEADLEFLLDAAKDCTRQNCADDAEGEGF
jgi:hypothetical protein